MKKFSTRLFSLLAVFCLVFFCFPLVSFASVNHDIDSNPFSPLPFTGQIKFLDDDVKGSYDSFGFSSSSSSSIKFGVKIYDSKNLYFYAFSNSPFTYEYCSYFFGRWWDISSGKSGSTSYENLFGGLVTTMSFAGGDDFLFPFGDWVILDSSLSDSDIAKYFHNNWNTIGNVKPSLDSGLGSFVLGSNNAWANRIYGNNEYVGSFMTILRDTTTTGKKWGTDFDTLQYYTGVDHFTKLRVIGNNDDLGSFMSDSISIASDSQLTKGRGGHHFTLNCPEDFKQPMASGFEAAGEGSVINNISRLFTEMINNNSYSFKPVVVVRPYNSKTGAYGNWLRVTSGTISKSTLNSSQNGSSLIGSSSEDSKNPTINEPTGSVENKGVVSSGDTLDNAINNSYSIAPITNVDPSIVNNNYPDFYNQPEFQNSPSFSNNPNIVVTQSGIQSSVVSGGNNSVVINNDNNVTNNLENINEAINGDSSGNDVKGTVLSNIFGLLGMITAVPKMLSVLFGWLPSWALTCAGVAFALIIPLIIFKILRG